MAHMGAGKGQNRRLKSTSKTQIHVEGRPKPKFNFGDEIKIFNTVEKIAKISYDDEESTYCYDVLLPPGQKEPVDYPHDAHHEDDITMVNSTTPSQQDEYLKNCLDKIVVFRYRPELDDGSSSFGDYTDYSDLEQLDGQKARVIGVHRHDLEGSFFLDFYEINDESRQLPGVKNIKFHKEDFQFLEEILKKQQGLQKEFEKELKDRMPQF